MSHKVYERDLIVESVRNKNKFSDKMQKKLLREANTIAYSERRGYGFGISLDGFHAKLLKKCKGVLP